MAFPPQVPTRPTAGNLGHDRRPLDLTRAVVSATAGVRTERSYRAGVQRSNLPFGVGADAFSSS